MSTVASPFVVEGEFSIYRAAELAQALLAWWPQAVDGGAVQLDLAGVSEMDSAGLQLLPSAQRSAHSQGLDFHISAASEAVAQVLGLCALQHLLSPHLRAESAP